MNKCCKKWKDTQGVKLRGQHTISPKLIKFCPECSESLQEISNKIPQCHSEQWASCPNSSQYNPDTKPKSEWCGCVVPNSYANKYCKDCQKFIKPSKLKEIKRCNCDIPVPDNTCTEEYRCICGLPIKPKEIEKIELIDDMDDVDYNNALKINEIIDHINKEQI